MNIKPIYYFYGQEELMTERQVAELKSEVFSSGMESLNFRSYGTVGVDIAEVVAEAMTLPAMSPMRMVVVKGAEALKAKQLEEFLDYLKDPSPTTCLVFISNAKKVDGRLGFFKVLTKGGYLVESKLRNERMAAGWVRDEAKRAGKTISPEASSRLVAIAGRSLKDIDGELTKIILFVGDRERIDLTDVESAGIDIKEESIFDLADAIGTKNLARAFRVLAKLSNEPPLNVLNAISRQIRILLRLKAFTRLGMPKPELARKLGVFPFFIDNYIESAGRFSEAELKRAFSKLAGADMNIKAGSKLPPAVVLTRLVMDLSKRRA